MVVQPLVERTIFSPSIVIKCEILLLDMMSLLCAPIVSFFLLSPTKENYESYNYFKAVIFYFCFSSGLKTYLISGRKFEHNVQCGCSQVGRSGGDFVRVSLSPCPQPCTLHLISGGAQAAQPLLPHQPPDRMGVSMKTLKVERVTYRWIHLLFIL